MSPDFPRIATPAEVWAYGTRELTSGANIVLPSQTYPFTNPAAPVDLPNVRLDGVRNASNPAAAIDVANLQTGISPTGTAREAKIDRLDNIPAALAPIETDWDYLTTDIFPHTHEQLFEYGVFHFVDGYIDLSALGSGETLTVVEAMSLVTPVSYVDYASEDYTGVVSPPMLHIITKPARYGIRLRGTMDVAPAADRILRVQFFPRRIA